MNKAHYFPELESLLDAVDAEYGGDMEEYLGPEWRDIFRPRMQDAWFYGYTEGQADSAKMDEKLNKAHDLHN